ncbi:hypothetical protein L1987_32499 [Smallanthus sonchifolius]|uniref:Uncharacterized protein n=1 Tax=Smallanthus sonchifolius TaxID=185202 RepID=A0ACB9HMW2_9ASTR|nr:hypothetical protein L1987_32499 [Smallanthus sonchifolius]
MCEICGGPHFTCRCPYSSGESKNYYEYAYQQVQPHERYRTREELNAWCKEANEQYERDIQAILARIGSHRPTNIDRVVYDQDGNEIGIETASGELILGNTMDDVQSTVTEGEAQVPPPGIYSDPDYITDFGVSTSTQDNTVHYDTLHLSCENELVQEIRNEDIIKEEQRKVQDIMNNQWHLITRAEQLHFLEENGRLMDELESIKLQKEEAPPEPRTKMGVVVPPSDLQGLKQIRPGVYEFSWDESDNDSFWSDDEDVIDDEENIEIPKTPIEDECFEEVLAGLFETDDNSEDELLVEIVDEASWEEEFGDELVGLPTFEEDGEYDPLGDLKLLEDLLYQEPSVGIEEEVKVQEVINEPRTELVSDLPLFTQGRERQEPVEEEDGGSPPRSSRPRDRARRRMDRHVMKVLGWSYTDRRKEYTGDDHAPHYMPRIKFGPSKFKYWWPDPFEFSKLFLRSATHVCKKGGRPIILNGPDGGGIKEKPPDR